MTSWFTWGSTVTLLILISAVSHSDADCDIVERSYSQFTPFNENTNGTFLDVILPNDTSITASSDPSGYVIIIATNVATGRRWEIVSNGTYDAEHVTSFNVDIDCIQQGRQTLHYKTQVSVQDVNEFPPIFTQSVYSTSVSELAQVGSAVFSVDNIAQDPDVSDHSVYYSVSSNQATPYFGLNPLGTEVQTLRPLDYDFLSHEYNLTITAKENAGGGKSSTALLTVHILDGDDLNPSFTRTLYNTTIDEGNYTNHALVFSPPIEAVDGDRGISAELQYSIEQVVPDTSVFTIHSDGSISVTGELPPDSFYSLNIRASQVNRSQERYDDAVVFIAVDDVNDHRPQMAATAYTVNLTENSPPGTVVTTVSATDADTGLNGVFRFYWAVPTSVFEIDTLGDQGIVRVAEGAVVDREAQDRYDLQIYAQETYTSERYNSSVSSLSITVLDVNDNSPAFSTDTYAFTIYKNDTFGNFVGQVNATDDDKGDSGHVTYTVHHVTSPLFHLDLDTGEITVNASLGDDDVGQVYMVVGAEDHAAVERKTSVATVIITIRDIDIYAPEFNTSLFSLSVKEDEPVNSLLLQIRATDKDSGDQLAYSLTAGNNDGRFKLDPKSGVLTLQQPLDREATAAYDLSIEVTDGQKTSSSRINVTVLDVNDNTAVFDNTSYTFHVLENGPTDIGTVHATDMDIGMNQMLNYTILSVSSEPFLFSIDPVSGGITTATSLDYEMAANYMLLVGAVDNGEPARTATVTVTVHVKDLNDNSPSFVSHSVYLMINEDRTNIIYTATAQDLDSGVNGAIEYGQITDTPMFSVWQNGSIVPTAALIVGDYNITVVAFNTVDYDVNCTDCNNATMTVMVHVSDLNNEPPRFNQSFYQAEINEGRVNNPVLRVYATDADVETAYKSISYSVVSGEHSDLVYISPTTGELFIFGDVDYDPPNNITLLNFTVEATDTSSTDTTVVSITINDINDNSPQFDKAMYSCQTAENITIGASFGCQVSAVDIDSGNNGRVQYSILTPNSPFTINQDNGTLTTSAGLDRETASTYTLSIQATDLGTPAPRSSSVEVTVNITDVNDTPPAFLATPYDFSIPETSTEGTEVGSVSASDPDVDPVLTFTLTDDADGRFIVQSASGDIQTLMLFNCSADYTLQVTVSDGVHNSSQSVNVHIVGVNQYTPQYRDIYSFSLNESATVGHVVGTVEAFDDDCNENGQVSFSLIGGNQVFTMSRSTGAITVYNASLLDHETTKEYKLIVRAEDGGRPPRMNFTTVTITVEDVDDAAPVFDRALFTATLPENRPNGTFVLKLSASDKDTPNDGLRYSFTSPAPGLFVNSSGTVMVGGLLDADGASNVISANVSVSDGTRVNQASILVTLEDVNDNSPQLQISQKNISVPENADVGQVILNVTANDVDRTNTGFTYWLTRTDGKFSINVSTGVISVENEFDRRRQDSFSVGVHVSDHGIPPRFAEDTLDVVIIDSNHAPVFNDSVFTFSVYENESIDAMVGQLAAYDEDKGTSGVIQYSFLSGNQDRTFSVDTNTGNITLHNEVDFEQQSKYTITVQATDTSYSPKSSTGTVIINVLDIPEAPIWPLPLPVVYMMKSRSCDRSRVTAFSRDITSITNSPSPVIYNLFNETSYFSLNNTTGALKAINPQLVPVGRYNLVLEACNSDHSHLCTYADLTIVVSSDTTLTFCPAFLLLAILEDAAVGMVVVDLNTSVSDSGVTYVIREGNTDNTFRIDPSTGVLTVAGQLDREKTERYTLLIEASDGNHTAQTQVVVRITDLKDEPPVFPLPQFNGEISESAGVGDPVYMMDGRTVLIVTAVDKDSNTQLKYSIDTNNDNSNGSFAVNNATGRVTLAELLDRETMNPSLNGAFTFKILASDENNTASTTVVVNIVDLNDNAPTFDDHNLQITIPENTNLGVVVTTVNASDPDIVDVDKLSYSILSPTNAPFQVDSGNGEVTVSGPLDRETEANYTLVLVVRDSGDRNDTMSLDVTLSDVNDNPPTFENSTYIFYVVEETAGVNSTMMVSAIDNDLNSNFTYSIVSGNSDNVFTIHNDNTMGVLRVVRGVDRESGMDVEAGDGVVRLTLSVQDNGKPASLSGTCEVEVHVLDVNDNDPRFDSNAYTGSVMENVPNNTVVLLVPEISATDPDNGINGTSGIRYSTVSPGLPFRVDAINGTVYVYYSTADTVIDRETTQHFDIEISAQDAEGSGRMSTTNISITVLDDNDMTPTFLQPTYVFNISEAALPRAVVGRVEARDGDLGGDSSIRYDIGSGDSLRFYIETLTGDIRVAGGLDRETRGMYSLNVSAFDGLHTGYTTVNITLTDANDNCPLFSDTVYQFDIYENRDNTSLGDLSATDGDIGENSQMTFYVNKSDVADVFAVADNGSVYTITSLDRESTSSYTFPVYVMDHGNPPCVSSASVNVRVLDENDVTPVFCQGSVCENAVIFSSILEKSPIDSVVALPQVQDGDEGENGRVTFSLTGDGNDLFKIDQGTGLVRVAESVDINKLFERGIISGNFSNNATFDLFIVAEDHGKPSRSSNVTLHLSVQELNDGAPEFDKNVYNFTIPEEESDFLVGRVHASARNTTGLKMIYSIIEGGEAERLFNISSTEGTIRTVEKLDRETRDRYSFAVQVRDGRVPERTAYAVVFVILSDINDNTPTFASQTLTVDVTENAAPHELLVVKATDADISQNARLTYSLSSTDDITDVFFLTETTGQLVVNASLDRELKSSYTMDITARDGGTPSLSSTVQVTVRVMDENDNQPTFTNTPYIAYIPENSPQGQSILTVSASDPDLGLNGQVVFRLIHTADSEVFQIGPLDGVLSTVENLDFESTETYKFTVMAYDLGTSPLNTTTSIVINVNDTYDTKPHFTSSFYRVTVAVATPVGTEINVNVDAGNGNFYYNITGGNPDNLFVIDPDTGVITVASAITTQGTRLMTVMAADKMPNQSFDTTQVYVTITDPEVTFPQEVYKVDIPENTETPFRLVDLNSSAEIQNRPVSYFFTSESEDTDAFSLNRSTGVLECVKSLDREEKSSYTLFIEAAIVTGRSKRAAGNVVQVVITVEDRNDNAPVIVLPGSGGAIYGIPDSASSNYLVVHLEATDPDSGENSVVRFSTASGDFEVFGVNPTSGEVRSLVAMTSVSVKQFSLTINVTDQNGNGQSTLFQMTIKLVPEAQRFGLVAHIQPSEFIARQNTLIGNLSSILALEVQLEKVEPHNDGDKLDLTRTDVYFHAIDPATGEPVPYSEISNRVKANQAAINALFGGISTLIEVTPAPTKPPPTVGVALPDYSITEAEIAILVIAGIMFIGSVTAVVAIIKIFRRYEEWHKKQEKAKIARERQKKITEERVVDEGFNETNVDSDTAEPLDLDISEESESREFNPGLLLRPTRMADPRKASVASYEDQEHVITFNTESQDYDTIVLRNLLASRELDNVLDLFDQGDSTSDSGTGLDDLAADLNREVTRESDMDPTYIHAVDETTLKTPFTFVNNAYEVEDDSVPGKKGIASTSEQRSDKGSIKSNKSKNVRFTKVVAIETPDSGNSSDSETHRLMQNTYENVTSLPGSRSTVDETTGDLVTWF